MGKKLNMRGKYSHCKKNFEMPTKAKQKRNGEIKSN